MCVRFRHWWICVSVASLKCSFGWFFVWVCAIQVMPAKQFASMAICLRGFNFYGGCEYCVRKWKCWFPSSHFRMKRQSTFVQICLHKMAFIFVVFSSLSHAFIITIIAVVGVWCGLLDHIQKLNRCAFNIQPHVRQQNTNFGWIQHNLFISILIICLTSRSNEFHNFI